MLKGIWRRAVQDTPRVLRGPAGERRKEWAWLPFEQNNGDGTRKGPESTLQENKAPAQGVDDRIKQSQSSAHKRGPEEGHPAEKKPQEGFFGAQQQPKGPGGQQQASSFFDLLREADEQAEQMLAEESVRLDLVAGVPAAPQQVKAAGDTLPPQMQDAAKQSHAAPAYQVDVDAVARARIAARQAAARAKADRENQQRPATETTTEADTPPLPLPEELLAEGPLADEQVDEVLEPLPAEPPELEEPAEKKPVPHKKTVRKKAKTKKKKAQKSVELREPGPVWRFLTGNPLAKGIGKFFYLLGFYAECRLLMVWRWLRAMGRFIAQMAVLVFGGLFGMLGRLLQGAWHDLTAPFVRLKSGFSNIRTMAVEEKNKGKRRVGKKVLGYFGSGVKNYAHLVVRMFTFLLPLAAMAIFAFTVTTLFNMTYALAVEVDGRVIGYVADELVVEEAKAILRGRIQLASDQSIEDWKFTPALSMGTTTRMISNRELANIILRDTRSDIVPGTGLFINNELYAVTTEGERLKEYLEEKLEEFEDPRFPGATPEYVLDVRCELNADDVFFASSVRDYDELVRELSGTVSDEVTFVADGEQSFSEIAHSHGVPPETLLARNPELEELASDEDDYEFVPEEGTKLLVFQAQPFLQVQMVVRTSEEEEIPFNTVTEENSDLFKGYSYPSQQGSLGRSIVYYDLVYVDGELVSREPVPELTEVIEPPVDRVLEVGTAVPSVEPGGVVGTGSFIWPVPNSNGSSRGFMGAAHRGRDINAPFDSAILACDAGVVIEAGWHYSWGNYVLIDHGNGMQTRYAHCNALYVSAGMSVSKGQTIAIVGSTGYSSGPHLHLEVTVNGTLVNPDPFLGYG